jgi:hypothetical protein
MGDAQHDMRGRPFEPGFVYGDGAVMRGGQTTEQLPAADGRAPGDEPQLRRRRPWLDSAAEESRHALTDEALPPGQACQRASGAAAAKGRSQADDPSDTLDSMTLQRPD